MADVRITFTRPYLVEIVQLRFDELVTVDSFFLPDGYIGNAPEPDVQRWWIFRWGWMCDEFAKHGWGLTVDGMSLKAERLPEDGGEDAAARHGIGSADRGTLSK